MIMGGIQSKDGGPPVFITPKCPKPFESAGNLACVMACPTERGFERRNTNNGFQCVYKADDKVSVTMNTVTATFLGANTVEELKNDHPNEYEEFSKEQNRFNNELNVAYAKVDKEQKLEDAFHQLQDAENARDTAPEAYHQARTLYYTLLKGDSWKDEEAERIARTEVDPIVQNYRTSKDNALQQFNNQKKTVEVVNGLKDKVLSLKDEFKYSVDTFTSQLNKVQNAVNMDRRGRVAETTVSGWTWLDVILNILIVSALLYAISTLYSKVMRPAPVSYVPATRPVM